MYLEQLLHSQLGQASLKKRQIYIVDDDESVCRALKFLVMSYGFSVEAFASADDFFNNVSHEAQGCLIMDIHMPGLNGWDAQQKLKKTGYQLPLIIISADKNGNPKDRALKQGALGFLQKPFNDQELIELIEMAFKGYLERRKL